nr:hypothetical protein [Rhodoferax sp.]
MSNDNPITPADEKALAMYYAYAALVRALCLNGSLSQDQLMHELAGANQQLHRIGETGAADFLGQIAQNLQAIDD